MWIWLLHKKPSVFPLHIFGVPGQIKMCSAVLQYIHAQLHIQRWKHFLISKFCEWSEVLALGLLSYRNNKSEKKKMFPLKYAISECFSVINSQKSFESMHYSWETLFPPFTDILVFFALWKVKAKVPTTFLYFPLVCLNLKWYFTHCSHHVQCF